VTKQKERRMDPLVTQSDDVAWGAAVVAGTRVPVGTLFEYLDDSEAIEEASSAKVVRVGARS
jgi:uncharacterized protein (DUF433 family)